MEAVITEENTPMYTTLSNMQQDLSLLSSHPLAVVPHGNMNIQWIHPMIDSRYLEMLQYHHALNQQCPNGVPLQYNSQPSGSGNVQPYVVYYTPDSSPQTLEHVKDPCRTSITGCRMEGKDISVLEDPIKKLFCKGTSPSLDVSSCNSANIIIHPLATHVYPECLSRSILLDSKAEIKDCLRADPIGEFGSGQYGSDGCWYPFVYNTASASALTWHNDSRSSEQCHGASSIQDYFNPLFYNKACVPALTYGNGHSEDKVAEYYSDLTQPLQSNDKFQEEAAIHRDVTLRQSVNYIYSYNHFHHPNLSAEVLGRPRMLPSVKITGQMSVESLFKQHVRLLFRNFPSRWNFQMAHSRMVFDGYWKVQKDLAKVRFYCETCLDGWTSMYGVVMFYFKLNHHHKDGMIFCQILGQKCNSCEKDQFQMPLWYPEEAQKVITNLYYRVAAECYGLITPKLIRGRRFGHPQLHHNSHLCNACFLGVCRLVPNGRNAD